MIQIIYGLLALIDMLVYSIASSLLGLISDLANTQFFKAEQITEVANRIYIVIGVLMLFKLVISAIQYMVNPDTFEDKEKGLAGILKKTAISIALIVLVPSIFSFMIAIQEPIVKTLPDIVLGPGTTEATDEQSIGFNLSFKVLSAFVKINDKNPKALSKGDNAGVGTGKEIHDFPSFVAHVTDDCPGLSLFGLVGNMDDCQYNYMIIISTLCGGFLVYVLLSMVLDISIRTIKFGVIQILAPIPIAGYVFNKDRLNKFVKTTMTVYLDLFIRMIIIYFVIFAIKAMIIENDLLNVLNVGGGGVANTGDWFRNVVVNVALVIGLLMFAKSAPKFISELLGLPDIGSGELADMFKPAWQRAGGAAGALVNPFTNAAANWRQTRDIYGKKGHRGEALRRAIAGFGKGALDSAQGVMNGDDWNKMRSRHDQAKQKSLDRAKRLQNRRKNEEEGASRLSRVLQRFNNLKDKLAFKQDPALKAEAQARYDAAKERLNKMGAAINRGIANGTLTGEKLTNAMKAYNNLKNELADPNKFMENEVLKIQAERDQQAVINNHQQVITQANARISQIDADLQNTALTDAEREALIAEKMEKVTEIQNEETAIEKITHAKEMAEAQAKLSAAQAEVAEIDARIAGGRGDTVLDAARDKISRATRETTALIATIDSQLANNSITDEERTNLEKQKEKLIEKRDKAIEDANSEIDKRIVQLREDKKKSETKVTETQKGVREVHAKQQKEIQTRIDEYVTLDKELVEIGGADRDGRGGLIADIEKQIKMVDEGIRQSGWRSSLDSYFGGIPVSGKGYTDLASLLGSTRSSIYTGEAMTKMRQNADILVDENGDEFKFTTKFATERLSYQRVADLKAKMEGGTLTDADLKEAGIASIGMLKSAFEDIEKKAAAAYITANVEEIENPDHVPRNPGDPGYVDTTFDGHQVRLRRHEINSAVEEFWNTFEDQLVKSGVPGDKIGELKTAFRKNPGKFMASASSIKDTYSVTGKKIIDAAKPDDGKK